MAVPALVMFDPNVAHLEMDEILVAPSTANAWTPLFFKTSGFMMEVG